MRKNYILLIIIILCQGCSFFEGISGFHKIGSTIPVYISNHSSQNVNVELLTTFGNSPTFGGIVNAKEDKAVTVDLDIVRKMYLDGESAESIGGELRGYVYQKEKSETKLNGLGGLELSHKRGNLCTYTYQKIIIEDSTSTEGGINIEWVLTE